MTWVEERGSRSVPLRIELLEPRDLLTCPPIGDLPQFFREALPVGGPDDTTGIAVSGQNYTTTDSYEEVVEIRSRQSPHTLVAAFSLNDPRAQFGVPAGTTSGGPDGMTSVTAFDGAFYVIAVSPFSTDAIYRIPEDGSSVALFAQLEIHNSGGLPFNGSELAGRTANQFFLGTTFDLRELNGSGQTVATLAQGNLDGVAVHDKTLWAITRDGTLFTDPDVTDGDGDLDLAVANRGAPTDPGGVTVSLNNGDASFAPAMRLSSPDRLAFVTAADLDRDGRTDLAIGGLGYDSISVLRNQLVAIALHQAPGADRFRFGGPFRRASRGRPCSVWRPTGPVGSMAGPPGRRRPDRGDAHLSVGYRAVHPAGARPDSYPRATPLTGSRAAVQWGAYRRQMGGRLARSGRGWLGGGRVFLRAINPRLEEPAVSMSAPGRQGAGTALLTGHR
jgi:FG-GAP-like repeat